MIFLYSTNANDIHPRHICTHSPHRKKYHSADPLPSDYGRLQAHANTHTHTHTKNTATQRNTRTDTHTHLPRCSIALMCVARLVQLNTTHTLTNTHAKVRTDVGMNAQRQIRPQYCHATQTGAGLTRRRWNQTGAMVIRSSLKVSTDHVQKVLLAKCRQSRVPDIPPFAGTVLWIIASSVQ